MTEAQKRLVFFLSGTLVTLLVVLLLVVLLGGDGDDSAATTAPATTGAATTTLAEPTTTTAAATTTSAAATTTTAAATTTTAAATTTSAAATTTTGGTAGSCSGVPGISVPAGATLGPQADFNGDGLLDRLITFEDAGTWWVAIRLSNGYAQGTAVFGPAWPVSIYSFDGFPVGFARIDGGASTEIIGTVVWAGCSLYEPTVSTGGAAHFLSGGSVTHLDGLSCSGDTLTTSSATSGDGTTWEYVSKSYLWVPGLMEFQLQTSSISTLTSPADDAIIFGAGAYGC